MFKGDFMKNNKRIIIKKTAHKSKRIKFKNFVKFDLFSCSFLFFIRAIVGQIKTNRFINLSNFSFCFITSFIQSLLFLLLSYYFYKIFIKNRKNKNNIINLH